MATRQASTLDYADPRMLRGEDARIDRAGTRMGLGGPASSLPLRAAQPPLRFGLQRRKLLGADLNGARKGNLARLPVSIREKIALLSSRSQFRQRFLR